MKSVAHVLKAKADRTVYTIAPTASVFDAVKLMVEKNIGALVARAMVTRNAWSSAMMRREERVLDSDSGCCTMEKWLRCRPTCSQFLAY